jgi:hypothetical protein
MTHEYQAGDWIGRLPVPGGSKRGAADDGSSAAEKLFGASGFKR